MDAGSLDYELPEGAIAQEPVEPRDAARLLVDRGPGAAPEHRTVAELAALLEPGDVLVVNDTRVRRARLRVRKPTGGEVEVLLVEPAGPDEWLALLRPGRRVAPGTRLTGAGGLRLVVGDDAGDGLRTVGVEAGDPEGSGEVPLPPYIHRPLAEPERYQTVFARHARSAAAPTAGLHLTDGVLAACRARGVQVATVDLVIGLDTFRPITVADVDDHPIHTEAYEVPAATWDLVEGATGNVVAVGTTVVRALETAARGAQSGRTDLFIRPGFEFAVVDRLLTNFHVPRTTLLAMVEAFVGPRWRDLYATALNEGYRFLSFGDACLLTRSGPPGLRSFPAGGLAADVTEPA